MGPEVSAGGEPRARRDDAVGVWVWAHGAEWKPPLQVAMRARESSVSIDQAPEPPWTGGVRPLAPRPV